MNEVLLPDLAHDTVLFPLNSESREEALGRQVRLALACSHPPRKVTERRRETRHPYPYPVYLTPLDSANEPVAEQTVVVVGKHLSEHGVDFYHRAPFAHKRVICSLHIGEKRWVSMLLELTWCRFSKYGWYDNGGRFLNTTATPPGIGRE